MRQRIGLVTLLVGLGGTVKAAAQLAPVGVPPGMIRLDFHGALVNYDQRFLDGQVQNAAADFVRDSLGSNFWPELVSADTTVGAIIGQNAYRINLGRSTSTEEVNLGTAAIGVALGLTSKLSLFADIPFVRVRVQPRFLLDSTTADAGFNPADPRFGTGGAEVNTFFSQLSGALTALGVKLANGDYDANAALKAKALATLAGGNALRSHLDHLMLDSVTASPFVPTGSSTAGTAMTSAVSSLQSVLSDTLGVTGFTAALPLPTQRLAQTDIDNFITNPAGPVAGRPVSETRYMRLGDITVGAVFTVVDDWDRGPRTGGLRVALTGKATLPTGLTDRPDDFFDLGTGTGHYALGAGVTADLGAGRLGARLTGGYDLQLQRFRVRRVSAPSQPMPYAYRLTNLQLDPGDELSLGAHPFFRLARTLALQVGVDYWRRYSAQARYNTPADSVPGVSASELVLDSGASATVLSGGVTFAGGMDRTVPIEAEWTYEAVLGASGGRVPQGRNMRAAFRIYYRLWK